MRPFLPGVFALLLAACASEEPARERPRQEPAPRESDSGRPEGGAPPAAAGGNAAGDPGPADQAPAGLPEVVAEMEGFRISREDFLRQAVEWYGRETLEEMILRHVFERAVADSGASFTEKELDDRVALELQVKEREVKQRYGLTLKQYVEQLGKTVEQLRTEMKANEDLRRQILLEYMLVYAYETEPKVEISHIVVRDEAKAEALRRQAADGLADFGELAKKESDDAASAPNGGRLPAFIRGMTRLGEGFEDAAFALEKPGEVSPVVKTSLGYHILRLNKKWPANPQSFENVREKVRTAQKDKMVLESFMRRLRAQYVKGLRYNAPELQPEKR